ncbi:class I SAM-dependent methyltransferase family protein [Candidatus Bathyarchaeota archaeon]|nr:class I SAM-dependent methyltransferase family protein [Candidatus Bathyarchaeota archaeon]
MEKPALKVEKCLGEEALKAVSKLGLLDRGFKVKQLDGYIAIPLVRNPTEEEFNALRHLNPVVYVEEFEPRLRPRSVREALEDMVPEDVLSSIPASLDLVGDVAIIQYRRGLEPYLKAVGEAVMKVYPRVKSVLVKTSPISGEFRVGGYMVVAGSGDTETVHKEHGCLYAVDPVKVYFSPRLSYERFRVASMVKPGERVLDMFTGVGCYAILIAKKVTDCVVYAVDINPVAVKYLKRNIAMNKVQGRVIPVQGDVVKVVEEGLKGVFDRVIMDNPSKAKFFLKTACQALKPSGGVIHYYGFYPEPNPEDQALKDFRRGVLKAGRLVESAETRIVREVSPRRYHVAVDGKVC